MAESRARFQRAGDAKGQVEAVTDRRWAGRRRRGVWLPWNCELGVWEGAEGCFDVAGGASEAVPWMFWRAGATAALLPLPARSQTTAAAPGRPRHSARWGRREDGQASGKTPAAPKASSATACGRGSPDARGDTRRGVGTVQRGDTAMGYETSRGGSADSRWRRRAHLV
jgi:hypothetical protein